MPQSAWGGEWASDATSIRGMLVNYRSETFTIRFPPTHETADIFVQWKHLLVKVDENSDSLQKDDQALVDMLPQRWSSTSEALVAPPPTAEPPSAVARAPSASGGDAASQKSRRAIRRRLARCRLVVGRLAVGRLVVGVASGAGLGRLAVGRLVVIFLLADVGVGVGLA